MVKTKVSKKIFSELFFNHIVSTRLTIAEDIAAVYVEL